jgi:hypothetical protein
VVQLDGSLCIDIYFGISALRPQCIKKTSNGMIEAQQQQQEIT